MNFLEPDLFSFAYVPGWYAQLDALAGMARPEPWRFRGPMYSTKNQETPILERYIHAIFKKQAIDYNEEKSPEKAAQYFHVENEYACFHTGLYTARYKAVYGKDGVRLPCGGCFGEDILRAWGEERAGQLQPCSGILFCARTDGAGKLWTLRREIFMGVWKSESTVITDAGMQLLADIAGKEPLRLSRAVAGTDYTSPAGLAQKTGISHVAMDLEFSEIGRDENRTAFVDVYLENSSVTEAFYHQQIGIYAKDAHVYITHRIFIKFSGNAQVEVYADFSGVVTQETLREALKGKENAFDKNSAFNRNFSGDASDYMPLGKQAHPGGSSSVARADHVHPLGTMLRFAENNWGSGRTNLLPDTNPWVMSSGRTPDVWGGYAFEATFTSAWEGFSCFFDASLLENVRGKTVEFGVGRLEGASFRLELIVDGSVSNYILATDAPASVEVMVPETAAEVTLRIIIFSADDLHCAFTGVYLYDKEEETAGDDGKEIYLAVRKVLQEKLPASGVSGTLYITERGNLYLAGDGGTLIPLAGSEAI